MQLSFSDFEQRDKEEALVAFNQSDPLAGCTREVTMAIEGGVAAPSLDLRRRAPSPSLQCAAPSSPPQPMFVFSSKDYIGAGSFPSLDDEPIVPQLQSCVPSRMRSRAVLPASRSKRTFDTVVPYRVADPLSFSGPGESPSPLEAVCTAFAASFQINSAQGTFFSFFSFSISALATEEPLQWELFSMSTEPNSSKRHRSHPKHSDDDFWP